MTYTVVLRGFETESEANKFAGEVALDVPVEVSVEVVGPMNPEVLKSFGAQKAEREGEVASVQPAPEA